MLTDSKYISFEKIKTKTESINERSDCKVISLVGISYLLATHCCVMELDSQGSQSNAGIKERLGRGSLVLLVGHSEQLGLLRGSDIIRRAWGLGFSSHSACLGASF